MKTQTWTEEKIKNAIFQVMENCDITAFPSHAEMNAYYGNRRLSGKISRTGGSYAWAKKLNMPMKLSETTFGRKHELLVAEMICQKTGFCVEKMSTRHPYDLLVDKCIKVDVKAARPTRSDGEIWQNSFHLEKRFPTCDIYFLVCIDPNNNISKIVIIPSCITYGSTQIAIGILSKWDVFIDKWDLFEDFHNFYDSISNTELIKKRRSKRLQ